MKTFSLTALFAVSLANTYLLAADATGGVAGRVVDPSGALVASAKLTITSQATGLHRDATTAADGGFVFPLLPPGAYNLVAEASGFRHYEQRGVTVPVNVTVSLTVTLQLGAISESVQVEGNAEQLATRSGTLSQTVEQRKIVELPLNGRNAASLILLTPGTADLNAGNARGAGDTSLTFRYPGALSVTSSGGRADGVNYQLDGGSNRDPYLNVNNPTPNPDALEEFSVQTNAFSAEHGNATGAVVNVVTKSGTNEFHGSGFEFFRNGALNARNFFAARHDLIKRSQFGGTMGGPIVKDRLFFFGSYQGTIQRSVSGASTAIMPTAAQREGNFSALLPSTQLVDPITRQPFPGNIIPTNRLDPITAKLFKGLPVPTAIDGRIRFDRPDRQSENQVLGRVDYQVTRHRVYGRYFLARYPIDPVMTTDTNFVRTQIGYLYFNQGFSASDTFTIRPNLLNSFSASYNRNHTDLVSGAGFSVADLGANVAAPTSVKELRFGVTGYFSIASSRPAQVYRNSLQFSDSLHWIRGRHQIYFGGEALRMDVKNYNPLRQVGYFTFTRSATAGTGDAMADFFLGSPDRLQQGGGEYGIRHYWSRSLYVQDNLRATTNLTLNLGLRWDPFTPPEEENGKSPCYLPGAKSQRYPNAPTGYIYAGDAGCPAGGSENEWMQLAPRFGFAYNVGGKGTTTIRGGVGLSYQPPFLEAYNQMSATPPFSQQVDLRRGRYPRLSFQDPYGGAGVPNPFPAGYGPKTPGSDAAVVKPVVAVTYATDWKPSQVWTWNFTVERQIARDLVFRTGYAGAKGTHLGFNTDLNAGINGVRPNPDFDKIIQDIAGANSIYNSLIVAADKRFSKGFSVGASYTWGKSLDWASNLSDLDTVNVINPYRYAAYRAVSDYNVPHRFVLHYVWQLPSPKGSLRHVFGGWQTTGIWNWQSGFPLSVSSGVDNSGSFVGNDLADVVSQPSLISGSRGAKIAKWFTTEAFRVNTAGTYGTAGRNILTGPGSCNADFSAAKVFSITDRVKLQYRLELFNAFNHTALNNPDTSASSGSFGQIVSARDPRIMQMALRIRY
jgi:hypothetical protein